MPKRSHLTVIALSALLLAGCTTTYTMTTRTGEVIQTHGKPEADPSTSLTKYADTFDYHREIRTSEVVQTTEGGMQLNW